MSAIRQIATAAPLFLLATIGVAVAAPAGGEQPTLLGQFGDWNTYTAAPSGKKVCFVLAEPSARPGLSVHLHPPGRERAQ
jgi:hypothetical protein